MSLCPRGIFAPGLALLLAVSAAAALCPAVDLGTDGDLVTFLEDDPAPQPEPPLANADLGELSELIQVDDLPQLAPVESDLVPQEKPILLDSSRTFVPPGEAPRREPPQAALSDLTELIPSDEPASDLDLLRELANVYSPEQELRAMALEPPRSLSSPEDPLGDVAAVAQPDAGDLFSVPVDNGAVTATAALMTSSEPIPPRTRTSPPPRDPETSRAQVSANRLESFCKSGEFREAIRVYNAMPRFGNNDWINKFRADSANLLVLHLCRDGKTDVARKVYDTLPAAILGEDAMLAKARAILNLTTFYIRDDDMDEGFSVFTDYAGTGPHPELNPELFRLVARMIPYLDNSGEADKAEQALAFLLERVDTPETAALYAEVAPGLIKYLLARPNVVEEDPAQDRRMALMRRIFQSLSEFGGHGEVAALRIDAADQLHVYYNLTGEKTKAGEMADIVRAAGKEPTRLY